jgi:hypothetical protein
LVTRLSAIQATGLPAFTLTGLTPAEHTSLSWTHNLVRLFITLPSQFILNIHYLIPDLEEEN